MVLAWERRLSVSARTQRRRKQTQFNVRARIDTPDEAEYYSHEGILAIRPAPTHVAGDWKIAELRSGLKGQRSEGPNYRKNLAQPAC